MRLMEEDLTELADEAKEDEENDDREDEKKGKAPLYTVHIIL